MRGGFMTSRIFNAVAALAAFVLSAGAGYSWG